MSTKLIYVLPYLTTTTTTKINIKVEITFKYLLLLYENFQKRRKKKSL